MDQDRTTDTQISDRSVIIHCDDLGMAHSINRAAFAAFEQNAISSGSVMVVCPWFTEVAEYAKSHPTCDIGIHLTLTSEWEVFRWGPISSRAHVGSLTDPNGYFFRDSKFVAQHAVVDQIEMEIRAQIESALKAGVVPTHLDSHMFTLLRNEHLFRLFCRLGEEYKLPTLAIKNRTPDVGYHVGGSPVAVRLDALFHLQQLLPSFDEVLTWYTNLLKVAPVGLSQITVHLGFDDPELRGIARHHPAWGSTWRQRDFDVVTNTGFRTALAESRINVTSWSAIRSGLTRVSGQHSYV